MKNPTLKMKILLLGALLTTSQLSFSQGVVKTAVDGQHSNHDTLVNCASHHFMEHADKIQPGYMQSANEYLKNISDNSTKRKKTNNGVYQIPVVFHVVYNHTSANIADSVIYDQMRVLNECFRRQNSDTNNTRQDFKPIVGDSNIEFVLASTDPNGNPTNGITRTYSTTKYFGGVLPYNQSQTQQIQNWVADSLFYNFFRITQDSLNGKSAWNSNRYVNVWVGDFRIFEPQIGNFEELTYFGLATPPPNHPNWPTAIYDELADFQEGILLHYPVVGSNNPNDFPAPYTPYNPLVKTGKMLVHEMGHYLGLRHIWGDGSCSMDDHIDDTPRANASSQFDCNASANTCVDTILGMDLPNMIENYMDYSNGDCQNSFTQGQINVMRTVVENSRPSLLSIKPANKIEPLAINHYPNPTSGDLNIKFGSTAKDAQISVLSIDGKLLKTVSLKHIDKATISLENQPGLYLIQVVADGQSSTFKVIKQ